MENREGKIGGILGEGMGGEKVVGPECFLLRPTCLPELGRKWRERGLDGKLPICPSPHSTLVFIF